LTFSAIELLTGGSGIDNFLLADGVKLEDGAGVIDGAGGTDEISYAVYNTSISVDLALNSATGLAGISNIENITGGSAADNLTGDAADNLLTGGPGDDTYTFLDNWGAHDAVAELADGGIDTLNFTQVTNPLVLSSAGVTITVSDGINSATHSGNQVEKILGSITRTNILDLRESTTGQVVTLTDMGTTTGFKIDVAGSGSFDDIGMLLGSTVITDDVLNTLDAASTWQIDTTTNTYTSTNTLTFSGMDTLNAGAQVDEFTISGLPLLDINAGDGADRITFDDGAKLTGVIDGQAGADVLDFSLYFTARQAVLTGLGDTQGFNGTESAINGSFANIADLVGSTLETDTLTGANFPAQWELDADACYQVGTESLGFNSFESLIGGPDADTFTLSGDQQYNLAGGAGTDELFFADGATLTGSFDGQSGADQIDWSAYSSSRALAIMTVGIVDGFNGSESSLTGGFTNVDDFVGSSNQETDLINGPDSITDWQIGTSNRITVADKDAAFSNFEALFGGNLADTFTISGVGNRVTLRGGAGSDHFIFKDGASTTGFVDGQGSGYNTLDLLKPNPDQQRQPQQYYKY